MPRKRILLDCDGILADFGTPALEALKFVTGVQHAHDDITEWDMMAALKVSKPHEEAAYQQMRRKGFCESIPVYRGAQEGVALLRRHFDVYVVTAPFKGTYWAHERELWLRKHFDIVPEYIVSIDGVGDALVEDKSSTLVTWSAAHPKGVPICWDRPYNRHDWTGFRTNDWNDVIKMVQP